LKTKLNTRGGGGKISKNKLLNFYENGKEKNGESLDADSRFGRRDGVGEFIYK
jgi:hypothetical protein